MQKNEFIKQIRAKYKMSQKKFAEYLEVSKSLIEKVEMGKVPATPENKYVKAVCALEGLDNEIFKFDEITEEILKEYELTKFSKAFRKFLFFYYGDFWNEDIENEFYNKLLKTLEKYTDVEETETAIINIPYFKELREFVKYKKKYYKLNDINILYEIMIILTIKSFKLSNFTDNPKIYFDFIEKISQNEELFLKSLYQYGSLYYEDGFCIYTISFDKLKNDLIEIDKKGLSLTIENIKKIREKEKIIGLSSNKIILDLNKELIEKIITEAITDPKDKEICELLQYAPPAFKDKIIEKLKKFRDEVEDI